MKPPAKPTSRRGDFALSIYVEECRHYTRSNLQLLHILHSLSQGQSSVPMSTAAEGVVHTRHDATHITFSKIEGVIEVTSSLSEEAEEYEHGAQCPSGSTPGSLVILRS